MSRKFDVTAVVCPLSVERNVQQAFVDGGRQIAADLPEKFSFTIKLTPCVKDENDIEVVLRIAKDSDWKLNGSVKIPWGEAFRRAQLVRKVDQLGRSNGNKTLYRSLLRDNLGLENDRQLQRYLKLSKELFERYPVFLLQWKNNPSALPTSWNHLQENLVCIVDFIRQHPDLEAFYKGELFQTSSAFLISACFCAGEKTDVTPQRAQRAKEEVMQRAVAQSESVSVYKSCTSVDDVALKIDGCELAGGVRTGSWRAVFEFGAFETQSIERPEEENYMVVWCKHAGDGKCLNVQTAPYF